MKKMFLSLAVIASLCMASCTGTSENDAEKQATEVVDQINKAASETEAQDIVTKAQAYVEKLVKDGKIEEAKGYLEKIKPIVEQKFPSTAPLLEKAQSAINAAAALAGSAKENISNSVKEAADSAECKANCAVENAKDAANEAVDNINEKAGEAADAVKDAATNAAQNAADGVKNLLK